MKPLLSIFPAAGKTLLATLVCCCALSSVRAADGVITFAAKPAVAVEQTTLAGANCEIAPAPQARGVQVFKLAWPAFEGKFIAGHLVKPADNLFDQPGKYQVTARVCIEQLGAECTRLALRLHDGSREIFQYFAPITPGTPGWIEVSWTIDTANPVKAGSKPWGGNANGKLEFPVRLRGFALPFEKWKTQGGELWVDEIRVTPLKG